MGSGHCGGILDGKVPEIALFENGTVVPLGDGDGQLKAIFTCLNKSGYDGFLSMEPHLFDFAGFAGLEQEDVKKEKEDGAFAFRKAFEALLQVLQ